MTYPLRPKTRLYVEDALRQHSTVSLSAKASHYLLDVLRLRAGAKLLVFNARDGEWQAELVEERKKSAKVRVWEQTRTPQAGSEIALFFAPLKAARTDFLVEKATELGAGALFPVRTDYTNTGRVNTERLQTCAVEAAEQTGRLDVPQVHAYQSLERALAEWPPARPLLHCDESGAGSPLPRALAAALPGGGACAVLVGPEGGFSPRERAWLRGLPFVVPVGLGPRVLRAETAALAALACVQAWRGDWAAEHAA
jgi:16S rRNA (uracil1498-N3)-methyltransferase